MHLVATADPSHQPFVEGRTFEVDGLKLAFEAVDDVAAEADVSSVTNTWFVAAESEVLLHHVSETLLRLSLALAPSADGEVPDAPWLELARERSFRSFKKRVRRAF